jgi:hypothetical protein
MAKKWWVELGDLYVSKKTLERLMKLGMEENEE